MMRLMLCVALFLAVAIGVLSHPIQASSPYAQWERGPSPDPNYFPIGVWLQNASRANRYKHLGINTYIGLSGDLTDESLETLQENDIRLIVTQNDNSLQYVDHPVIIGWLQTDEPDNAQP